MKYIFALILLTSSCVTRSFEDFTDEMCDSIQDEILHDDCVLQIVRCFNDYPSSFYRSNHCKQLRKAYEQ